MNRPLHVLVLDDAHADGALAPLLHALQRDGYSLVCRNVSALDQIAATLDEHAWDLVLANDGLPQNLALRALDLVRVRGLDLPFILIVGDHQHTDESHALRAVQAGASDCIEHDHPVRFLAAVERELRQSEVRRERERVENELRMRARQQETVAELGLRALTQKDLVELLEHVMEAVCSTLDVELVGWVEALRGGDTFVLRAGRGWMPGLLGEATFTGGHETFIGDTLQHGQVVVENLRASGRYTFPPFITDHRITSALSVALHRQDGPTGCLIACTSRRPKRSPPLAGTAHHPA